MSVLAAVNAVRTARTPQGATGWLVFLLAAPYVALPVYLFLGHARIPGYVSARRSSERLIQDLRGIGKLDWSMISAAPGQLDGSTRAFERIGELPVVSGNAADILIDGEESFGAIFEAIDRARSYVLAAFFIIRDDRLGAEFRDRLIAKAREGCAVHLLYDALGSRALPERYLDELRAGGVIVLNFHSIRKTQSRLQLNFRNHRKIVVVDGEVAFIGGLNIGDEYLGRDPYFGRWRDTMIALRGPVVAQAQLVFSQDWYWASDERLDLHWTPAREADDLRALIVAPGPADVMETGSLFFCNAIHAARRRIWISSPYFVPDVDILAALKLAALRGVDVRILIADKQDHLLVWLAAFAYFDEIREAGVKILRYRDGFLHQKVLVVDEELASVGTVNLDNRSCRLNFEITAVIFDRGIAVEVATMLQEDFAASYLYETPLDEAPNRLCRYGAPFARLFAPIL